MYRAIVMMLMLGTTAVASPTAKPKKIKGPKILIFDPLAPKSRPIVLGRPMPRGAVSDAPILSIETEDSDGRQSKRLVPRNIMVEIQ